MDLKQQVIRVWMIVYDGDADQIYSFTDFDKVVASVDGSVRNYLGEFGENESPEFDIICSKVTDKMREMRDSPCVPMSFQNLNVVVYNWELDNANPIHKVLFDCYSVIDDPELKERIENMFSASIND